MFGARAVDPILAVFMCDRHNRPDIWPQSLRSETRFRLLPAGGRPQMGHFGARHRGYVWSSCCGPHLGSVHVRPPQQTGHMAAIASIRNPLPPLASRGPSTYVDPILAAV